MWSNLHGEPELTEIVRVLPTRTKKLALVEPLQVLTSSVLLPPFMVSQLSSTLITGEFLCFKQQNNAWARIFDYLECAMLT